MIKNSELIAGMLERDGRATTEVVQEDDGSGFTVLMVSVPSVGDIRVSVDE